MALYVASHYKNTPNDLQLLSDAPAHHIFVLVPPVTAEQTSLPDVLCVVQVRIILTLQEPGMINCQHSIFSDFCKKNNFLK